jgi:hypothetical protein
MYVSPAPSFHPHSPQHYIEHTFPLRIPHRNPGKVEQELRRMNVDKAVPAVPADPFGAPPLSKPPYIEDMGLRSEQPAAKPSSPEPPVSVLQLGKRLAVDQIGMAPLGLAAFILAMGLMEQLDWKEIKQRFHIMYIPVLIVNWQVCLLCCQRVGLNGQQVWPIGENAGCGA